MKICITGRSHIAALRNGIHQGLFDPTPHEVTFLGAAGTSFRKEIMLEDGILRATGNAKRMFLHTSDGRYDHLDPKAFDAVVIYGTFFHLQTLFTSIMKCRPQDSHLFSQAFLKKGAAAWLAAQPTIATIKAMRKHSETPIVLMFEPFFSQRYQKILTGDPVVTDETRRIVFDALREIVEAEGARCVFQPEDTMVCGAFSKDELSIGSKRLGGVGQEHDAEDFTHLNSKYGAIALGSIFNTLRASCS